MVTKNQESEQGQTVVEYILLLSAVVAVFVMIRSRLNDTHFAQAITDPMKKDFVACYQLGHPKAKWDDSGTAEYHPRAARGNASSGDAANFRIFINPGS